MTVDVARAVDLAVENRSALPYLSRPKNGRGVVVTRTAHTVLVAGQAYTPAAALELSAAVARAANEVIHRVPEPERAGAHRG